MSAAAPELPAPIRKTCALYQLLAGEELMGLAPGEIAKGIGVAPSWVSQTLPALAETGFVERVEGTNRWRLGMVFVRIANTVSINLASTQRRLDEVRRRYATPVSTPFNGDPQ